MVKLIGDNYSMLKGGKVISVTEDTKNRKKVNIEYSLSEKTYTIEAYYNQKKGELSISKVTEVAA